jgi:surface protein
MSRFRCFDTYNLTQSTSSDRTTDVKRKTIFTEYQTIAIGNVNFQKGLTEGVIPPGYLKKSNGAYYYGPVYVTTDDVAVNNCLIGAKNYELLYDVLFGAQPSPDEISNAVVSYDGAAWQGNILKTNFNDISNSLIGPAILNIPDGSMNKMNYEARQDFIPKYNDTDGSPPNDFPGMISDPCYNIFYPRCSTSEKGNNYIKNVLFNFKSSELKNSEMANFLRLSSARKYSQFPYQLNFQSTTCEKYPFTFTFSFTNNSSENADQILLKYMPIINVDNTISYTIEYTIGGKGNKELTYYIRFKYTGGPSEVDGFTFYPLNITASLNTLVSPLNKTLVSPLNTTLVDFYNIHTTNLTIQKFDLMPLSPLGYQFNDLSGIIFSGTDVPIIKPGTSFKSAFEKTGITLNGDGISKWRTSGLVDMNSTFKNSNFNGNINEWNISNVIDIRNIFEGNTSFNKPINNWVFSKDVRDMSRMFYGASAFNQSINTWDTSNIVNMSNLFTGASTFDQSLNLWNTSLVRDMSEMFMNATSFNGNIRTWNTLLVETMHSMFKNAISFNGNIQYDSINNYWNTTNVFTFESIFENTIEFNNGQTPLPAKHIGIIRSLNWTNFFNFQRAPIGSANDAFNRTENIITNSTNNAIGITRENAFPFSKVHIFVYEFYDNNGTSLVDICSNYLPVIINGTSTITDVTMTPNNSNPGTKQVSITLLYNENDINSGISFYDPSNTKVNYYNSTGADNPITIISFDFIPLAKNGYQFYNLRKLAISPSSTRPIPTIYQNTSFTNIFNGSKNFNSPYISEWNVTNVINMSNAFSNISFNQDIRDWNTSNVTSMSSMFENNSAFNQNINQWNTQKVTDMSNMFKDAIAFNNGQGQGGINQPLNWQLNINVNLTNVRTRATNLTNQNAFPLPSLYTFIYDFYNLSSTAEAIISSSNLPFIINPGSNIISAQINPNTDTTNEYKRVTVITSYSNNIQDVSSGLSFYNVSGFFNANNASPSTSLKIIQFDRVPLARNNGSSEGYQFANLNYFDFSSNVVDVPTILPNTTLSYGFYNTPNFNSNIDQWDTSNVISMKSTFESASSYNSPLQQWNASKVIDMTNMFKNASSFNQQISYTRSSPYWDVRGVLNMQSIFEGTTSFNNGQVTDDTLHPLNWILNPNINTTNCIKNTTTLTYQNAYPLAQLLGRFIYTFYNTSNASVIDISNNLPIIKTSDDNLTYYYPLNIITQPENDNFTTVTVYFRYNNVNPASIDGVSFNNVYTFYNLSLLSKTITSFDNIPLAKNDGTTQGNQFANLNNLVFNSSTLPTIVSGTTFKNIFLNSIFNSNINNWNTTNVTSLNGSFENTSFNQPLNNWNITNVTDMSRTFYNNSTFNQDISGWQTDSLTNMTGMFYNCQKFNQNVSNWNLSGVTSIDGVFKNCFSFNNGYPSDTSNNPLTWNTNNVTIMSNVFYNATAFNQDIRGWNTDNVTTMANMFNGAESFNKPLERWNVDNVTNMSYMFYGSSFNQDISGWNTGNVTTMDSMFRNNTAFNQWISYIPLISTTNWDTRKVLDMTSVFEGALLFNNGQVTDDTPHPLNWILTEGVNVSRAVTNTPSLSINNAQPFTKIISGNFAYTFHNNNDATHEDITNNYIPFYNGGGNLTYSLISFTTPLLDNPSFVRIDISFSYSDNILGSSLDGLTFYKEDNSITNFYNNTGDRIAIIQFDGIPLSKKNINNEGHQFANLSYLDISVNVTDKPTILTQTLLDHTFYNTPSFNSGNIQKWDTLFTTTMKSMFEGSSFNQPLRFNTKNVTNMNSMFKNASKFNQTLSYNPSISTSIWNVSNVTDMSEMFMNDVSFNNGQGQGGTTQSLNWALNTTANITNVRRNTPSLTNQNAVPLPSIYTLKYDFYDNSGVSGEFISNNYLPIILNGKSMLYDTTITPSAGIIGKKSATIELAYVPDNNNTGLSFYSSDNKITNFYNNNNNIPLKITQFGGTPLARNNGSGEGYQFAFINQLDFSSNDVPTIMPNTTLSYGFFNCSQFNSDISNWNTREVTSMASLFQDDISFNLPLQQWNTSKVTNMNSMFKNASSFNKTIKYDPISNYWDVSGVMNMISMFENASCFNNGFPLFNYDNSLNWILNGGITKTNAVLNTPKLSDFNGLPLTIIPTSNFVYKFYNTHNVPIDTILTNYLPFIKTNDLIFDINKNISIVVNPFSPYDTTISINFEFTDDGITQDGLSFNSNDSVVHFYNQTQKPVEIIKFGGMPLSRFYKNSQQSGWSSVLGNKFTSFGYSVANGNNTWVSVGGTYTNTILRSTDATTWTSVSGPTFKGIGYAVAYGGNTWIAVGDDNSDPSANTILRSTNNGLTWVSVSGPKFSYAGYGIVYNGNGSWIALGDILGGSNTILTSSDSGASWSSVTGGFTVTGFGAIFVNNRWIAVGSGNKSILYSTDVAGTTWTPASGIQFTSYGQSIVSNGAGILIAIGCDNYGSNTILRSIDNGLTWSSVLGTTFSFYGQGLAYGGGGVWVAVGNDNGGSNTILYSNDDGQRWNPSLGIRFSLVGNAVSYNNASGRWVAVGDSNGSFNTIVTSIDGITWFSAKGTRYDGAGYGLTYNNNGDLVSVGYSVGSNNTNLYSVS